MANPEHLEILRQGKDPWNQWRKEHPEIVPDLSNEDLSGIVSDVWSKEDENDDTDVLISDTDPLKESLLEESFLGLHLSGAKMNGARIEDAPLFWTDLSNADLRNVDLATSFVNLAGFQEAILIDANIVGTEFHDVNLDGADLTNAKLSSTTFRDCTLRDVSFKGAEISSVWFDRVNLDGADFSDATMVGNSFLRVDLRNVKGLSNVKHWGPSPISIDTLYRSGGKIPEDFLLGCGVPEQFITFIPSLVGAVEPFQYHSCFISYSTKDEEFAKRLHSRLRDAKVLVWFAPEDIKGGVKLYEQIEQAIQIHDRLLVVLSENSLQSEWVMTEIRKAREVEKRENRRKLFPIRLVDFEQIKNWRYPDADGGKDLAVEVREYFIPDFSTWKDHDSFEKAFERLLRDLREAEGVKGAEMNGAQSEPQIKKAIEDGEISVGETTHTYKPDSLDELRSRLTAEQRIILNTISLHYLDDRRKPEWIRSGILRLRLGEGYDESKVRSIITPLGGSVVYETTFVGNGTRYVLTMLGFLLTERGEEIEIVFAKHLEYVCQRFMDTDGAGERVVLSDMAEKQELTSDQLNLLRRVIDLSDFRGDGGNDGYSPPHCVDKLVGVADLRAYVREHEFSKFDPHTPIIHGPFGYRGVEMPSKKDLQFEGEVKQPAPVFYISRPSINVQGDYMGDTNIISGQVGAVGQNAHAHDMTFNQRVVNNFEKSIDLPALAKQLAELREEMAKRQDSSPQSIIAQGEAAKAEMAAKEGNTSKVVEYLKAGGQGLLDIAKETSKELLTAAIKASMGMQ